MERRRSRHPHSHRRQIRFRQTLNGDLLMLATSIRASFLCTLFGLLPTLVIADEVKTFPVKGVDFTVYKTYTMLPVRVLTKSGVQENDPNISPFIIKSVRKELAKKGLTEVSEHADLQVAAGGLGAAIPQVEALIYNFSMDADWSTGNVTTIGRYNR